MEYYKKFESYNSLKNDSYKLNFNIVKNKSNVKFYGFEWFSKNYNKEYEVDDYNFDIYYKLDVVENKKGVTIKFIIESIDGFVKIEFDKIKKIDLIDDVFFNWKYDISGVNFNGNKLVINDVEFDLSNKKIIFNS